MGAQGLSSKSVSDPAETLTDSEGVHGDDPVEVDDERFGRYRVTGVLGRGSTGVVFAAHDPDLDRDVAIKSLLPERLSSTQAARIRAEAVALAQLNHPHVVRIYDVGEADGEIFIVMERVHGQTLRAWMDTRRGPEEILELFLMAGEGLLAVHELDLIHRDFKPANVLVDERGPKVVDFGLVRGLDPSLSGTEVTAATVDRCIVGGLTETGRINGTPAYMSPEQFSGLAVDAKADQFSFCVALWEALEGARPFAGDTVGALAGSVLETDRATLGRHGKIPRRLVRVLRRGLAVRSTHRFPSMRQLLDELRRATVRRRWPWLAVPAAAMVPWLLLSAPTEAPPQVSSVVDDSAHDEAPETSEAPATLATLLAESEVLDTAGRYHEMLAVTQRAVSAEAKPEHLCRAHLQRARALHALYRREDANRAANTALELAVTGDNAQVIVRSTALVIETATRAENTRDADELLGAAQSHAERASLSGNDRAYLAVSEAYVLENHGEDGRAMEAADRGLSLVEDDVRVRASLRTQRAILLHGLGRTPEALVDLEKASFELTKALGSNHPDAVFAKGMLADGRVGAGQYALALEGIDEAIAKVDAWDPPIAPARWQLMMSRTGALHQSGDHERALEALQELRWAVATDPEAWTDYEETIYQLESVLFEAMGHPDEALLSARRLVDLFTERAHPSESAVLRARLQLGRLQKNAGQRGAAEANFRDVLRLAAADGSIAAAAKRELSGL